MRRGRGAALVVLLTLAAYANAPRASFQFDDWNVILRDPAARSLGGWWAAMPGIRPLLKLSYALCAALGLGSPGFHVVNVGIHLTAALLVLAILRRLAAIHGAPARESSLAALAGCLLFALHPVQTEAVTYACGRSVSLAALFALGSIAAWIEGRERGRPLLAFVASPLLAVCALAVKEFTIVVLPALLLLALCDPRRERRGSEARLALAAHAPIIALGLAALLASPVYRHLLATSLETRGIGTNLRTQAAATTWFVEQLLRPDRLLADPKLPIVAAWTPLAAGASAAVAALLVAGFLLVRRRPPVAFGILWFFLWLAPTNSFLPRLDVANDRQLYVALIGPGWLIGWWLARGPLRDRRSSDGPRDGQRETGSVPDEPHAGRWVRRAAVAGALAAVAVMGAATFARNRVYVTEIGFWRDVVAKAPRNARGHNNLGYAYALACRKQDAEAEFARSYRLDPADYTAPINLSMLRDGSLPGLEAACGGAPAPPVESAPTGRSGR